MGLITIVDYLGIMINFKIPVKRTSEKIVLNYTAIHHRKPTNEVVFETKAHPQGLLRNWMSDLREGRDNDAPWGPNSISSWIWKACDGLLLRLQDHKYTWPWIEIMIYLVRSGVKIFHKKYNMRIFNSSVSDLDLVLPK